MTPKDILPPDYLFRELEDGYGTLAKQGLLVPVHLRGGIERYVVNRIKPGHLLTAILENNLIETFIRASELSFNDLHAVIKLLLNFTPAPCWGSKAKVQEWLKGRDASHDSKHTTGDGHSVSDSTESRDTTE